MLCTCDIIRVESLRCPQPAIRRHRSTCPPRPAGQTGSRGGFMSVGCDFQCVFGGLAVGRRRRDRRHRVASFAGAICAVAMLHTGIDSLKAQETAGDESRPKEEIRFRLYRWQEDYLWLSRKTEPLSDYERFQY